MAVKITTTKELSNKVNILVYGDSGIGKTYMIKTAPEPIIISSEKKALSLEEKEISELPMWLVETVSDIEEVIGWLQNDKCVCKTVCVDSLSDIAEMVLAECKKKYSDGRKAYGEMSDIVYELTLQFTKELPRLNVYMIAKSIRLEDAYTNIPTWRPSFPGNSLNGKRDLVYLFDICCALRKWEDEDGTPHRYLQTEPDIQYSAKGLASKIAPAEEPDLTKLFNKILRRENG